MRHRPWRARSLRSAVRPASGRYAVHARVPDMRDEPPLRTVTIAGDERIDVHFVTGR